MPAAVYKPTGLLRRWIHKVPSPHCLVGIGEGLSQMGVRNPVTEECVCCAGSQEEPVGIIPATQRGRVIEAEGTACTKAQRLRKPLYVLQKR